MSVGNERLNVVVTGLIGLENRERYLTDADYHAVIYAIAREALRVADQMTAAGEVTLARLRAQWHENIRSDLEQP